MVTENFYVNSCEIANPNFPNIEGFVVYYDIFVTYESKKLFDFV